MQKLKLYLKRLLYIVIGFFILKMIFDVTSIPNYRGWSADFEYSDDKQYKGTLLFSQKRNQGVIAMLVRTSDNTVLAFEHLTRDSGANPSISWFTCYGHDDYKGNCFSPADFMEPVGLPPSAWHRVRAWLTIKIKGLENPNLKERLKEKI